MSFRSWLQARGFDIADFFTTSDVEAMRNQYRNLVNYLDKKVPELDGKISLLENNYAQITNNMCGGLDTVSSGGLVMTYDDKYTTFNTQMTELIGYYKTIRDSVRQKQEAATQELKIYEELVRQENERKAEMARQQAEAAAAAARAASNTSGRR